MTFFVVMFFGWMFLCRHTHQRLSGDNDDDSAALDDSGFGDPDFSDDDNSSDFPIGGKSYQSIFENSNGIV